MIYLLRGAEVIFAAGGEFEEVRVAEDLELLADFVADVAVVGMESAKAMFEGICVGEGEIRAESVRIAFRTKRFHPHF